MFVNQSRVKAAHVSIPDWKTTQTTVFGHRGLVDERRNVEDDVLEENRHIRPDSRANFLDVEGFVQQFVEDNNRISKLLVEVPLQKT